MGSRDLSKAEWREFFDRVSKALGRGNAAEVEVMSPNLGDQIEAEWVPLLGLSYDPKDDAFDVMLEGLDHRIEKPSAIYLEGGPVGLASIEIIDGEGTRQIVKLRKPVVLPA
jgi:uncharacterized protein DUF5335